MAKPLPLCVVGAGLIGMRHIDVARQSPSVELTAVVEAHPQRREELKGKGYPVAATLDDVPASTRAAIVATPTPDHAASGLAALGRGWVVLVEKPLTGTLAEADALISEAGRKQLPLVTGHHRRSQPFVQAAGDRLAEIGDLVAVQGMWSLRKHDSYYDLDWRRALGAGPLMTNLSHEIDLLRAFVGEIAEVSALSSNAARGLVIEDTSAISIRFESGVLGSFLMSDAGASPWSFEAACGENPGIAMSGEDYVRFAATRGAMSFPSLTLWRGDDRGEVEWRKPLHREAGPIFAKVDPIAEQLELFAAMADGREVGILASGEDGRATLEATLAAVYSAEFGHPVKRGAVPLDFRGTTGGLAVSGER